jgi:hypothetical protein
MRAVSSGVQVKSSPGSGAGEGGDDVTSDVIVLESLHPHATHVQYSGVVYLKGASALRIVIDRRTEVPLARFSLCCPGIFCVYSSALSRQPGSP